MSESSNPDKIDSPFQELIVDAFEESKHQPTHYLNNLSTGDEALLARIHLIRSARKCIYIQTFIWDDDESGRFVAFELLEAARRGVEVRIIIDHFAAGQAAVFSAYFATREENLDIKFYSPISKKKDPTTHEFVFAALFSNRKINQRMHNKTFIVDNSIAIVGGRNYANDYFDRSPRCNFKDRDVLIVGPIVKDIVKSFEDYWCYEECYFARDLQDIAELIKNERYKDLKNDHKELKLNFLFKELNEQASSSKYIRDVFVSRAFEVQKVSFVSDEPGKNKKLKSISLTQFEISAFIAQAQKSVIMQTPYLVLDKTTYESFKKMRKLKPDLDIRISTNSLAGADNLIAYSFAHKQRKEFVRDLKFRIFEMKPEAQDIQDIIPTYADLSKYSRMEYEAPDNPIHSIERAFEFEGLYVSLHAKSFVIDDDMTWVGSFNIDPRSAYLNTEVGVMIWDRAFAQEVKEDILRDIAPQNSWTIAKRSEVAIRSYFSGFLGWFLKLGLLFFWPYKYTESFDLRSSKEQVSCFHSDFYKNYQAVGPFPGVKKNTRDIEIELIKSFGAFLKPIV